MKRLLSLLLICAIAASLAACGNSTDASQSESQADGSEVQLEESGATVTEGTESEDTQMEETKSVASDGAQMQTDDPSMPTRVLEEGTRINMYFGDTVIPGILNDSTTTQAFIEMLPLTVHVSRYSHDFCGSMDDFLPFDEEDERYG